MAFKMKAGSEGPFRKNFPSAFNKDKDTNISIIKPGKEVEGKTGLDSLRARQDQLNSHKRMFEQAGIGGVSHPDYKGIKQEYWDTSGRVYNHPESKKERELAERQTFTERLGSGDPYQNPKNKGESSKPTIRGYRPK